MTKALYQYTLRDVDLGELNTWAPVWSKAEEIAGTCRRK